MGRYLDALKKSGKVGEREPNKPNKPPASPIANGKSSFLGFLGTPPPTLETIFSANDDTKQPDTAISFAWLIHFTDREPLTVSFSPEVTQAEALASYPDAVAAEPIAPPLPIETSCRDCQHFMRPGHSSGYCAGRDDLPFAYGVNHPLRKLPDDGGASCEQWRIAKERKFDGN